MHRTRFVPALLAAALLLSSCRPAEPPAGSSSRSFKVERQGPPERCEVEQSADGTITYRVYDSDGRATTMTPEEHAQWLLHPPPREGWRSLLHVTGKVGLIWVAVGLLGQVLFSGRMLVQWIASERAKRSVVPLSFWWMSLGGSLLLGAYFTWRQDLVGMLGQGAGIVIYVRNLILIRRVLRTGDDPAT